MGQGGPRGLEPDPRKPMQANGLDHGPDLGLRIRQPKLVALDALAPSEHGQVDHQRGVREGQLPQIHGHIAVGLDRLRQGSAPMDLGRSVLVSLTAQDGGGVIELDDLGNL